MTRFAENREKLEQDGAMIDYRKEAARNPDGFDAAEWIEALHVEHWQTLKLLRESESERVARMKADLQMVLQNVKRVETAIGLSITSLGDVLGDTPAVLALNEVGRDLRRTISARLDEIIKERQL